MQPVATVVGGLAAVNTDPGLELVVTSAAFAWLPLLAGLYTVCAVHYYRDRQSGLLPVKVRQSGGRRGVGCGWVGLRTRLDLLFPCFCGFSFPFVSTTSAHGSPCGLRFSHPTMHPSGPFVYACGW